MKKWYSRKVYRKNMWARFVRGKVYWRYCSQLNIMCVYTCANTHITKKTLMLKIRIKLKKLQIKVVRNWISYKKVRECIRLSLPGVGLVGLKDWYGWNSILYWNTFNLGLNTARNTHRIKKVLNKNCSELNFVQKSSQTHMSITTTPLPARLRNDSDQKSIFDHIWWIFSFSYDRFFNFFGQIFTIHVRIIQTVSCMSMGL